jgi:hypothetical protein
LSPPIPTTRTPTPLTLIYFIMKVRLDNPTYFHDQLLGITLNFAQLNLYRKITLDMVFNLSIIETFILIVNGDGKQNQFVGGVVTTSVIIFAMGSVCR